MAEVAVWGKKGRRRKNWIGARTGGGHLLLGEKAAVALETVIIKTSGTGFHYRLPAYAPAGLTQPD